jgi:RNase P/RNase MRP subunit p29
MSKLSPREFLGARVKFVRLSDNTRFFGWIVDFSAQHLEVEAMSDKLLAPGERFVFDIPGSKFAALCEATLTNFETFDPSRNGDVTMVPGSNVTIIEARFITLRFKIEGSLKYAKSEDQFRIRIGQMPVTILGQGQPVTAMVVDVGERGMGLTSPVILEPTKVPVSFEVSTPIGAVVGKGVIRYCEPDSQNSGRYRAGLLITELGRLDAPRWLRLVREVL